MTDTNSGERGERPRQSFALRCLTGMVAIACLWLLIRGGMSYRHGAVLQAARHQGRIGARTEKIGTPAIRSWFTEELMKPLDRVVEFSSSDLHPGELRLVNGLRSLKRLDVRESRTSGPLDLSVIDWRGLGRLETLHLEGETLDLTPVDWSALRMLRELTLAAGEYTLPLQVDLPAGVAAIRLEGLLHPDLIAAVGRLSSVDTITLSAWTGVPQPSDWARGLRSSRASRLTIGKLHSREIVLPADQIDWRGLGQLQGVDSLQIEVADAGFDELQILAANSKVRRLSMGFSEWRDSELRQLSGFDCLEELSIGFLTPQLDDLWDCEALSTVVGWKSLRKLKLSFPGQRNADRLTTYRPGDVRHLLALPHLQSLTLIGEVEDKTLATLAEHPQIEELRLCGRNVTLERLAELSGARRLRKLEVAATPAARHVTDDWRQKRLPGVEIVTKLPGMP